MFICSAYIVRKLRAMSCFLHALSSSSKTCSGITMMSTRMHIKPAHRGHAMSCDILTHTPAHKNSTHFILYPLVV